MILVVAVLVWLGILVMVSFTPRLRPETRRAAQLDLAAFGALGVLTAGFFWQLLFTPGIWMPAGGGDLAGFIFPTYHFAQEWITRGVLPLWNPFIFGGTPFLADIQTALFYPPNLITFFLSNPLTYPDLEYLAVLHFYVAGAGMFALLRYGPFHSGEAEPTSDSPGSSRLASLAGACAFAFSDLFITHFGNLNLIATASWLPLAFLFFAKALENQALPDTGAGLHPRSWVTRVEARNIRLALLGGIVLAISFFAGHIQPYLFNVLVLALYALYQVLVVRGEWRRIGILSGVTFATAVGLTAITLVPALELSQLSVRSEFTYADAVQFSLPPIELVGLLVPGFFGRGPQSAWSPWQRVEVGYIGVLPLMLALLAVLLRRNKRTLFYLLLAGLGLLLALGGYAVLHGWLFRLLPGLGQLRAPARFVFVMDFGLAVLAAIGLDALASPLTDALRQTFRSAVRTGAWVALWVALVSGALALGILILGQGQDPALFQRIAGAANALAFFILLLGLAFALLLVLARGWISGRAWSVLALALIVFDLFSLGAYVDVGTSDPTLGYQRTDIIAFLRANIGQARMDSRTDVEGTWRPDTGLLYRIQDMYGDNPLVLRDFDQYWELTGGRDSKAYQLLNVKYVLTLRGTPMPANFRQVFEGGGSIAVWENRTALPRAGVVHSARVGDSLPEIVQEINSGSFDPRAGVILSGSGARELAGTPNAADRAEITSYAPNEITLATSSEAEGFLVLGEIYAPGWRAWVDGQEVPVVRANGVFRAVPLSAGAHEVRLVYDPLTVRIGAIVSAVTLVVVIGLWVWTGQRMRNE